MVNNETGGSDAEDELVQVLELKGRSDKRLGAGSDAKAGGDEKIAVLKEMGMLGGEGDRVFKRLS